MVDADNLNDDNPSPVSKEFSSLRSLAKSASASTSTSSTLTLQTQAGPYLTTKDFNYTITLIDNKINALYKLCRHIGDEQQENLRLISRFVAIDELSDRFWNVSFSNIYRPYTEKLLSNLYQLSYFPRTLNFENELRNVSQP